MWTSFPEGGSAPPWSLVVHRFPPIGLGIELRLLCSNRLHQRRWQHRRQEFADRRHIGEQGRCVWGQMALGVRLQDLRVIDDVRQVTVSISEGFAYVE